MKLKKFIRTTSYLVMLFSTALPAHATVVTNGCGGGSSCTLTQLFAGGSITINDVVFNSWMFDFNDGGPVDPATVVVSGIDEVATGPSSATIGLGFTANPAISSAFTEYDFDFTVTVGSIRTLTGASLDLNEFTTPSDSFVEINGNLAGALPDLQVDHNGTMDAVTFGDLSSLMVDADIQMEEGGFGNPSLTQFDFGYTLAGTPVPVPAAFPLFLSALIGLRLMG